MIFYDSDHVEGFKYFGRVCFLLTNVDGETPRYKGRSEVPRPVHRQSRSCPGACLWGGLAVSQKLWPRAKPEGGRQCFQNGFRDGLMAVNLVAPCSVGVSSLLCIWAILDQSQRVAEAVATVM